MADNSSIFRKKSLDRVSSPEQLNDYIKVASPGMWAILLAIIVLLAGMIVWGAVGKLETTVKGAAVVSDGSAILYVSEENVVGIEPGQTVRPGDSEMTVRELSREPIELEPGTDSYLLHAGGFEEGEWVYLIPLDANNAQSGTFECEVVTDSVSPLSFVMN